MSLRSLLFVPGDRPERFAKAEASGADALILDLEDAVAQSAKDAARRAVAERLRSPRGRPRLFVRVNPLGTPLFDADIAALASLAPDAVVLPKAEGGRSVLACAERLAEHRIVAPILPIATETPAAIFGLGSYGEVRDRLAGLTWGAEDLPAAIGASTSREADGRFTPPYEIARSLTLFAAHAAGTAAIETVYPAFKDEAGLDAFARRAARDGFTGMMAIHPAQVPVINAAFTPSADAVAAARRIVEAFAAAPDAGALQVDGRMVDAPHLAQARKLLDRAGDTA
ncbi:HpcH/HpaI aldolase/citrate lyase family protein [Aureimonas phyllosphaerae]|uniref:Citrate lyase subunit beta/citryl-CoA lyase n=1 Tax=Aureimonas phyllosphaerae TaxID=1166078 RepID=A0A7W6BXE0_9HYPH|nr:CoA ester lyase [Aureimonas phyllosphaerae]MBB3936913.1 citrate lyase subunit beta/citryl-CoA lyase [Aureimonas phyllosphaerae]MBB3960972.1 citrate lyase subunit beta/citryl-CoA lyase [Aureimonas phyllosphaerae]SFF27344.1 citrate lyase subunit beta / citryl-CoA lyase [Aureimonas phyllosphaerae]